MMRCKAAIPRARLASMSKSWAEMPRNLHRAGSRIGAAATTKWELTIYADRGATNCGIAIAPPGKSEGKHVKKRVGRTFQDQRNTCRILGNIISGVAL